ncbi:MAG: DivIVA domain-containing protein [Acidimicrobiales bacterium]
MDELSPLFQEIEFHERYRGYDPDEVDAFVDRVARAAAVMRGRITELHERVDAAESRGGGASHSEAEETLTRTLVLAQRTADAAIAEAREEADRVTTEAATSAHAILSASEAEAQLALREAQAEAERTRREAQEHASRLRAEAETDRRTMVAEAESIASEAAAAERERLVAEVAELQEYRTFLADDIEILERHLAEERHQLSASVSALTDLLESPEAFRVARPPATSGVEVDAAALQSAADVSVPETAGFEEEFVDDEITGHDGFEVLEAPDEVEAVTAIAEETVEEHPDEIDEIDEFDAAPVDSDDDGATIDLVAAEAVEPTESSADPDPYVDDPDSDPDADPGRGSEPAYAGMSERFVESRQGEPSPPRLVTVADLESAPDTAGRPGFETSMFDRSSDDGGPITEAVPAMQEGTLFLDPEVDDDDDDPFLSQLRDAMDGEPMPATDDDALTAFFDQEDEEASRSWFGRRR